MQITLDTNSWHYKLYSKVLNGKPPKSLCPYFWTIVALVVFSPFLLMLFIMFSVMEWYDKTKKKYFPKEEVLMTYEELNKYWIEEEEKDKKRDEFWQNVGNKIQTFISLFFIVLFLFLIYAFIANSIKIGWLLTLKTIGFSLLIGGSIVLFFWLLGRVFKLIIPVVEKIKTTSWSITKMIGGMIYATYTKACPLIEWKGLKTEKKEEYDLR
jgi:hypothetical protein